jgi:hypothetical protein
MSALARAREALDRAQGKGTEEESLESKILKQDADPPLTKEEQWACQAAEIAAGDWGPVFVYGQMLSQQAWCALIGRVPEMRPAWLRGYERREIRCSTFAGLIKNDDPDALCVGQAILGLMPWERRLLDEAVDDAFQLIDAVIQPLDDLETDLLCTTYIWRESKFPNAFTENDWEQDRFNSQHEVAFTVLCADILANYRCSQSSDEELKEKALRRRRNQTGFEDEDDAKPENEDEQEKGASGDGPEDGGYA